MSKLREKTIAVLVFAVLAMSFAGTFAGAEFPWTTSLTTNLLGTSTWTTSKANTGFYSVHLATGPVYPLGPPWLADEARFVVTVPSGITLGDIYTISWQEFLVAGYPPHVDIILDLGGSITDALVFEYAYNNHITEAPMPYGALTGYWYQTFSDDGLGPAVIDGTTYCWLSSGPAGGPSIIGGTLNAWKTGGITGGLGINTNTPVLRLEFELDNWVVQSDAYLDDVEINGLDIMGVFGPTGATGVTGATGIQGVTGDTGATGPEGDRGSRGMPGVQGIQGLTGLDGTNGTQGPQGEPGDSVTGPQGESIVGPEGSQGIQGEPGLQGPQGESVQGPQGEAGDEGTQGPQGEQGELGPQGPQGEQGLAYIGAGAGVISLLAVLAMFFRK